MSGPQHIYSVGEIVEVEGTKGMIFKVSGYMAIVVSLDEVQLPIKNFGSSHFTAVDWCRQHGVSSWKFPNLSDLRTLYRNKKVFNRFLVDRNLKPITGDEYWSSEEYDSECAQSFNMKNGTVGITTLNSILSVRAIGKFKVDQ